MSRPRLSLMTTLVFLGVLLVLFLLQTAGYNRSVENWGKPIWPGWYTLIVDEGLDPQTLESSLLPLGFSQILHARNLQVAYPSGISVKTAALSELPRLFDEADPRWDPYLKSLPRLFEARNDRGGAQVLYLRSDRSLWDVRGLLSQFFQGSSVSWSLAEWSLRLPLFSLALSGFALVLLLFLFPRQWVFSLIGYALWVPLVFRSGGALAPLALALHGLWVSWTAEARFLLPRGRRRAGNSFLWSTLVLFAGHGAAALYLGYRGEGMSLFLLGIVSEVLLFVLYSFPYLVSKAPHRLFEPLRLCAWNKSALREKTLRPAVLGFALFLLLPLLPHVGSQGYSDYELPQPRESLSFSGELLRFAGKGLRGVEESTLPSLSGLTAHRAFLQGFLFGREFSVPRQDEEIRMDWFSRDAEGLTQESRVLFRFSGEWLDDQYEIDTDGAALLLSPERPYSLVWGHAVTPGLTGKSALGLYLLALMVSLLLVWKPSRMRAPFIDAMTSFTSRRRRKAA